MKKSVIFFDNDCSFCNKSVDFILKHDKNNILFYSSLKGTYAKSLDIPATTDYIVFYHNEKMFIKSQAIFVILKELGGIFTFLYFFKYLPRCITDNFYNLIAKNRYKIFTKTSCNIKNKKYLDRFIP